MNLHDAIVLGIETQISSEDPIFDGIDHASSSAYARCQHTFNGTLKAIWDDAFEAGATYARNQQRPVLHMLAAECERLSNLQLAADRDNSS